MADLLSKTEIVSSAQFCAEPLCGIYFLIDDGDIVYVGQSVNLLHRVWIHCMEGQKRFSKFHYIECPKESLDDLEAEYIVCFKPLYNVGLPRSSRWFSLKALKKRLATNLPTVKKYIRRQGICDRNGFYDINDFLPLLTDKEFLR